ncbi:bifunctional metallophosphatase/5'-nucleotidase [Kineosporia rhizophila]|uniref:bifunctional metallophosphatase/5'-nucleotidase n=1 Tax=Kineosporia TaxID=49184 RepID=UPI000A764A59|nr:MULTISPECIES: bifunctional metallophosphatase/5'-nucleotidase [Kineosporia]MCE0538801.1 bifunctional metallophosphatase/5'-nucleotidase [Kineosporia rhizophila]GLY18718.1 multifunctional 2',3'-cyclic-nucleotide 2'-phosphodiesterase/5'-nucleotidase/3'-nucleotidase [Kineosporia sp. NBRC 101677]
MSAAKNPSRWATRARIGTAVAVAGLVAVPSWMVTTAQADSPTKASTPGGTSQPPWGWGTSISGTTTPQAAAGKKVTAQLLAFNDLHGHMTSDGLSISAKTSTSKGSGYVAAGGTPWLAGKIAAAKKDNPNSLVLSTGDQIGGSPLISGYFHDEGTIEAMNKFVDVAVVGNHEFDEGTAELRRLINGGCHPVDGCSPASPKFSGTQFDMLAANVIDRKTGKSMLPGYVIKKVGGARIGIIGTVTPDTVDLVPLQGIADVKFVPEAPVIRKLAKQLRGQGVDAVIAMTHSGADPTPRSPINSCRNLAGPARDLTARISGHVDAVLSAHTHQAYICKVNGTLLTSAASYGRLLTKIKITMDTGRHEVTRISAGNVVVTHTGRRDARVTAVVERYREVTDPIAGKKVTTLNQDLTRTLTRNGESYLGRVIADAQQAATRPKSKGGAQLTIVNRGLARMNLEKGRVTYGDVFDAQPMGNRLVTMTLTGRQIDAALESTFCHPGAVDNDGRMPIEVSRSFFFSFDMDKKCGHKIRIRDMRLNGERMSADKKYRVTTIDFFSDGGSRLDGFPVGKNKVTGVLERDALAQYLKKHPGLGLPRGTRIRSL